MISVCMATYNGERFIKEQLDSILPQLSQDDELIVSDDGSTDKTLEIIASYKDERIKVFHHQKTGNKYYPTLKVCYSTRNFENALKQAKGDYIFLCDQDDIWEKNKVEESLKLLKNYDCVFHNFSEIDDAGNLINEKFYKKNPLTFNPLKDIVHLNIWGCCICFNREILNLSLPIPEKVPQHDIWIGLVCERNGTCFWNDEVLIRHRIYAGNTSFAGKKSENSFLLKVRYRLNIFKSLLKVKNGAEK